MGTAREGCATQARFRTVRKAACRALAVAVIMMLGLQLTVALPTLAERTPAHATDCPAGVIALTFDDGPGPYTERILDVLARRNAPSTFFVIGSRIAQRPHLVLRAKLDGHEIANHTYGHERLTTLSNDQIRRTITRAQGAIRNAGVEPLRLLRPPFGATNSRVRQAIESTGHRQILWDVDPRDWERRADQIRSHVLANLSNGAVILLHDGSSNSGQTLSALPGIIDGARSRGYCFGVLDNNLRVSVPSQVPRPSDAVVVRGDWNGDGIQTPGWVKDGVWHLRGSLTGGPPGMVFRFGRAGWAPVVGDWNGDGRDTPGMVSQRRWFVVNQLNKSAPDHRFDFGRPGWIPVAGDWNGNGRDTPAMVSQRRWFIKNSLAGGPHDHRLDFGRPGWRPVAGDWTGDGRDTPGVVAQRTWFLKYTLSGGRPDAQFEYGRPNWQPLAGDWNGNDRDGIGSVAQRRWYLRHNANALGPVHIRFDY